jgi:hypothetical protein
MNNFEGQVNDWNMGTLLRVNSEEEVNEQNTTLGKNISALLKSVLLTCKIQKVMLKLFYFLLSR